MSDLQQKPESRHEPEDEPASPGPSLALLYSLIGFALIAAIFLAGLIVLPFYRRR
jgi:hypothetical protein